MTVSVLWLFFMVPWVLSVDTFFMIKTLIPRLLETVSNKGIRASKLKESFFQPMKRN